jgi:hypothetical protein
VAVTTRSAPAFWSWRTSRRRRFSAEVVVDGGTDPFTTADDEPSEKVAGFVAFCDLDTAAAAIPDAGTVIPLPR